MVSRRSILKFLGLTAASAQMQYVMGCSADSNLKDFPTEFESIVYKVTGDDIPRITQAIIESMGGIKSIIDKEDIVVLKPNSQWWLQGMTNTDVMASFIELILAIPNFSGEIIIADNHQANTPNSRGWTTDKPNGKYNYNDLIAYFNNKGFPNVTKYHWNPAGPNPTPLQMDGSGNAVVKHPSEGDGYIWPKDLIYTCPHGNRTILSYPIFTSAYSGITIDFKNGAFKNGEYTDQPIKFINFSAINHHSRYTGLTASVKNYMGVVDMTCGYPAPYPKDTFNTHHIGASKLFTFMTKNRNTLKKIPYFYDTYFHPTVFRFKYTGAVLGRFMKNIRKADLNIITAINVGWGSRIDTSLASRANTITASKDPVALDYWTGANVVLPLTISSGAPEKFIKLNDPTPEDSPFKNFLNECRREIGGTIDPTLINIVDSSV